jgi:hypothetical protein
MRRSQLDRLDALIAQAERARLPASVPRYHISFAAGSPTSSACLISCRRLLAALTARIAMLETAGSAICSD